MTGTGSSRIWTRASGRRGISVPRQEVERNSLHSGANRLKTRLFPAIDRGSTQGRMHGRRRTETEPQGAAFSLESNADPRSEEHTSELQSLMRISYAVFCFKKKKK